MQKMRCRREPRRLAWLRSKVMRASNLALVSVLAFAACSSSGGGESAPPPEPNDPPTLSAPAGLGGGPVQFNFLLPIAGAESLTFTATDPDGDVLSWQVAASGAGQAAAGLSFSSPASGPTFTIDVAPKYVHPVRSGFPVPCISTLEASIFLKFISFF